MDRAARELPMDPTVLEHLGDLLLELGDSSGALVAWDQALEAGPEDPLAVRVKIDRERLAADSAGEGRALEGRLDLPAPPR